MQLGSKEAPAAQAENWKWILTPKSTVKEMQTWLFCCVNQWQEVTAVRGHVMPHYCRLLPVKALRQRTLEASSSIVTVADLKISDELLACAYVRCRKIGNKTDVCAGMCCVCLCASVEMDLQNAGWNLALGQSKNSPLTSTQWFMMSQSLSTGFLHTHSPTHKLFLIYLAKYISIYIYY